MPIDDNRFPPPRHDEDQSQDPCSDCTTLEQKLSEQQDELDAIYDQLEEALAQNNSLTMDAEVAHLEFEQIFDAVSDAMWVVDTEANILFINAQFQKLLGLKKTECIGKKCYDLNPSDLCRTKECPLQKIRKFKGRFEKDMTIEFQPGQKKPYLLTASPLFGLANDTVGVVEQYKDITERKNYEEALEKLATIDGLTQLANRRTFEETLAQEWSRLQREKQPLSVILCDVDFFKLYNDHYGHQRGDTCLQAVAKCLQTSVHRAADLPARYGGEEFVVVLPNTPLEGGLHVAERIRQAIQNEAIEHAQSKVNDCLSLSLGVATAIPDSNHDPKMLVEAADLALYAAKENGRNRVTAGNFPPTSKNSPDAQ